MQTQSLDRIADQLVFVHLDITCWSGKKSLTAEDLGLDRTRLPPESLVSLGDKQLINPEALRAFTSLRGAARRQCLAVGTRFLGGYALPVAKAQGLLDQLAELQRHYEAARAAFLADYDGQLAAWAAAQPPEWQPLIREALVPAEYVGGRLGFAVRAVRFGAPDPAVVAHGGLTEALAGLGGQVFHEVAQLARDTLEKSFRGKAEVTRRALGPFKAIRDKLDGLSFVDGRFRAVVREIDRVLASIAPRRPIVGWVLEGLRQFLCLAAQPDGLRAFADNAAPTADLATGGFDGAWFLAPRPAFEQDAGVGMDPEVPAEAAAFNGDAEAGTDPEAGTDTEVEEADAGADAETEPATAGEDASWFF